MGVPEKVTVEVRVEPFFTTPEGAPFVRTTGATGVADGVAGDDAGERADDPPALFAVALKV